MDLGASFDITGSGGFGIDYVWLFAEETCCCVQSCTFACGPDIPFTS